LPQTQIETGEYGHTLGIVRLLCATKPSRSDNHHFLLSPTDLEVAAAVLVQKCCISTTDRDLEDFLKQEFDLDNESPLKIVNNWIEKKLIVWSDAEQRVLEDWVAQNERRQPLLEIQRFEKLVKRKYPRT
jgi:hypothetical protein